MIGAVMAVVVVLLCGRCSWPSSRSSWIGDSGGAGGGGVLVAHGFAVVGRGVAGRSVGCAFAHATGTAATTAAVSATRGSGRTSSGVASDRTIATSSLVKNRPATGNKGLPFLSVVLASTTGTAASGGAGVTADAVAKEPTSSKVDIDGSVPRCVSVSVSPPSWQDLEEMLNRTSAIAVVADADADADGAQKRDPVLTLYRDTNGWCPFCERVWLALRIKKIPYRERLINLQNKPDWYKELVPTTLVPAVLFHDDEQQGGDTTDTDDTSGNSNNRRSIVWESMDILRALDDRFPETPRLVRDTPEFKRAKEVTDELVSAGFAFAFGARNASLTAEDLAKRRAAFEGKLNQLDQMLVENSSDAEEDDGRPSSFFALGSEFTAMDCILIPTMERWRYQLKITHDFDIAQGRRGIQRWFDAMDALPAYSHRVAGDEYSWTAVTSFYMRVFGGGGSGSGNPAVSKAIERADVTAQRMAEEGFADRFREIVRDGGGTIGGFALEAANKLIANREAVVKDCTREDPVSQKHLPRAIDGQTAADLVLRHVARMLLSLANSDDDDDNDNDAGSSTANGLLQTTTATTQQPPPLPAALFEQEYKYRADAALAARTVAARLCVPRDMGAPAAALLRGALAVTAQRLLE